MNRRQFLGFAITAASVAAAAGISMVAAPDGAQAYRPLTSNSEGDGKTKSNIKRNGKGDGKHRKRRG